jgi:tripartite-type tricarboxylate transporter receptor subunit TctC
LKNLHFASALVVGLALATLSPAKATEFNRTVTIIVPFAAGGITDQTARLVGERLSTQIGQPVVVENRTGANGQAAIAALKSAPADGHTLLMVSHGMMAINPALYSKLAYSPTADFVPLTLAIKATHLLLVPASSASKGPADLMAAAKRQPGALKFASVGVGSGGHLAGELFKAKAQTDLTHVPYRGSTAALPDVVAGRIDLMFDGPANSLELVRGGQLRALAVTDERRMTQLPNVPTMVEAGFPDFVVNTWFGFVVLAGTPSAVTTRLHAELIKAIKQPSFAQKVEQFGATAASNASSDAFARFIASESERFGALVRASGARLD